jgi:hypothetical protein
MLRLYAGIVYGRPIIRHIALRAARYQTYVQNLSIDKRIAYVRY